MTPEKKVENHIKKEFIKNGGYIIKNYASPNMNKGIPDLIGVMNGIYIALEIKKLDHGKPTPVQIKNLQEIANANGIAMVTNDDQIIKKIKYHTQKYGNTKQKIQARNIEIHYLISKKQLSVTEAKNEWQNSQLNKHTLQILNNSERNQ